jgi:hypothetical protein
MDQGFLLLMATPWRFIRAIYRIKSNAPNCPNSEKSDPTELDDYKPIRILPALSKAMKIVMRD